MLLPLALTLSVAAAALAVPDSQDPARVGQVVAGLRAARSARERIELLGNDRDFVFDFLRPRSGVSQGTGGRTVVADANNFPAVIGNGVAMTLGFLGPCGLNTPHTHPRATEFNFAVNGTLRVGILQENSVRFITQLVPPGSAAVFPKGAIHFEQNESCEPVIFVAAFNDENPGTLGIAQGFFGLPADIVSASLGGLGVEVINGVEELIPNNVALGTAECLRRCGIATNPAQQLNNQRVSNRIQGPGAGVIAPGGPFPAARLGLGGAPPQQPPQGAAPQPPQGGAPQPGSARPGAQSVPDSVFDAPIDGYAPQAGSAPHYGYANPYAGYNNQQPPSSRGGQQNAQALDDVRGLGESVSGGSRALVIALAVVNGLLIVGLIAAVVVLVRSRSRSSRRAGIVSVAQGRWNKGDYAAPMDGQSAPDGLAGDEAPYKDPFDSRRSAKPLGGPREMASRASEDR